MKTFTQPMQGLKEFEDYPASFRFPAVSMQPNHI